MNQQQTCKRSSVYVEWGRGVLIYSNFHSPSVRSLGRIVQGHYIKKDI